MKYFSLFAGAADGARTGVVTDVMTDPTVFQGYEFPLDQCWTPEVISWMVECQSNVTPGYTFDGTTWTAPALPSTSV